jgi:hypothetical protein
MQLGLDFPTCPVGLIAGDEYTYETFDEIVREVRPLRIGYMIAIYIRRDVFQD